MQQLKPNTTLQGGKYKIERVLGQGGFGNTYSGFNTVFDERIAIKEFFMQGINDRDGDTGSVSVSIERNKQQFEEQREKFKKEALRIRKLNNPHIIKVHDLFEENGTAYYVMDYVDGENLAERLKRTGKPMSDQEVSDILPQLLDALKTVHDAGVWHLDLKPANIMMDKAGNVKLIDFGASKQLNAQKGGATTSTAISYTNGYAPREQMEQNYEKFGPWTDIYALGATLYTLLANKRPPLPTDIDDDISEDKHLALPMPAEVMGKKIHKLILWMMSTNRNRRPQSAEELLARLEDKDLVSEDNSSEETILAVNDNEETIIANFRIHKKEERENNSNKRKEDSLHVNDNKIQSSKQKKWLFIAIPIIGLILGIFIVYSILSNTSKDDNPIKENKEQQENYVTDLDFVSPIGTCKYSGFVDTSSRPNGLGEAVFEDGRYYRGNFEGGKMSGPNAYFKYPNGDVFEGSFKDNMFDYGTYTIDSSGEYFTGTYKDGNPLYGKWYDKNGNVIEEL